MLESVCVCVCVSSFYVFMPGYFPLPSQIFWRLLIKCDSANKAFYAKNPLQQKKKKCVLYTVTDDPLSVWFKASCQSMSISHNCI